MRTARASENRKDTGRRAPGWPGFSRVVYGPTQNAQNGAKRRKTGQPELTPFRQSKKEAERSASFLRKPFSLLRAMNTGRRREEAVKIDAPIPSVGRQGPVDLFAVPGANRCGNVNPRNQAGERRIRKARKGGRADCLRFGFTKRGMFRLTPFFSFFFSSVFFEWGTRTTAERAFNFRYHKHRRAARLKLIRSSAENQVYT